MVSLSKQILSHYYAGLPVNTPQSYQSGATLDMPLPSEGNLVQQKLEEISEGAPSVVLPATNSLMENGIISMAPSGGYQMLLRGAGPRE